MQDRDKRTIHNCVDTAKYCTYDSALLTTDPSSITITEYSQVGINLMVGDSFSPH